MPTMSPAVASTGTMSSPSAAGLFPDLLLYPDVALYPGAGGGTKTMSAASAGAGTLSSATISSGAMSAAIANTIGKALRPRVGLQPDVALQPHFQSSSGFTPAD